MRCSIFHRVAIRESPAADGLCCLTAGIDAGSVVAGARTIRPSLQARNLAVMCGLWTPASLQRVAPSPDADAGGLDFLKASGRSLSQRMPGEFVGALRRSVRDCALSTAQRGSHPLGMSLQLGDALRLGELDVEPMEWTLSECLQPLELGATARAAGAGRGTGAIAGADRWR